MQVSTKLAEQQEPTRRKVGRPRSLEPKRMFTVELHPATIHAVKMVAADQRVTLRTYTETLLRQALSGQIVALDPEVIEAVDQISRDTQSSRSEVVARLMKFVAFPWYNRAVLTHNSIVAAQAMEREQAAQLAAQDTPT